MYTKLLTDVYEETILFRKTVNEREGYRSEKPRSFSKIFSSVATVAQNILNSECFQNKIS